MAPKAEAAAVVKADGYGLGAIPVTRALHAAGCRSFFVATLEEGLALAVALPDVLADSRIFVLHGFSGGDTGALIEAGLIPVLSTPEDLSAAAALAAKMQEPQPSALHIDTGMNRLGLSARLLEAGIPALSPLLVMSHLACADEPRHPQNTRQNALFARISAQFPGVPTSLANSAGVLLGAPYHYDLVRPGIALYGGNPTPGSANLFKPVARLEAPVLQVRAAEAGESVGYGATHRLAARARIATIGLGYADGYLRSLSGRGEAAFGPHRAPIIGRVSMDLLTVDVTAIPSDLVQPGAYAELLGPIVTVDEVALTAGTISYEVLTRLGRRLLRSYAPAA